MPEKGLKRLKTPHKVGEAETDEPSFVFSDVLYGTREQENLLTILLKDLQAGHEVEYTERYCSVRKKTYCEGFVKLVS